MIKRKIIFIDFLGEVRDMMVMHQFDEYQMHENLGEANDNFMMRFGQSNDSGLNSSIAGLSTVNEEPDDLQTNPSGMDMPRIIIQRGSISSQGSDNASMTSDDLEFQKKEEERIKEMYKVLNIERRKSVAKTKADSLDIARDYVRRASTIQALADPKNDKSRAGSRANSRRGSLKPSNNGGLNPNDVTQTRRGSIMPAGNRRPSTIFMPPKTVRERQPSVF